MANILITLLGKGQVQFIGTPKARSPWQKALHIFRKQDDNIIGKDRVQYRNANFFLSAKGTEKYVTTPFIGEALIRLNRSGTFDKVYILGTNDSMWDVLFWHCVSKKDDSTEAERLKSINLEIRNRKVSGDSLRMVGEKFRAFTGVSAECKVVELGKDVAEVKNIYNSVINIPGRNDRVSIDITHGLRFHPFLMFLAILYLKTVKDIDIKHVFYGGLELSPEFPLRKGFDLTPILDFKEMLEYSDWINAADTFRRYGDVNPLFNLLHQHKEVRKAASLFSSSLQLNLTGKIKAHAADFIGELDRLPMHEDAYRPLELISPLLRKIPDELAQKHEDWEVMLALARHHLDRSQIGLSVLSAWEAIIARFGKAYGIDSIEFPDHTALSKMARNPDIEIIFKDTPLEGFRDRAYRLNGFRVRIAHADENVGFSIENINREYPKILHFLEANLASPLLEELPNAGFVLEYPPTRTTP